MDKEKNKFVYGILVGLLIGTLCFSIVYLVTKDKKVKYREIVLQQKSKVVTV